MALYLSGNPEADTLLSEDPLALLIGMVLDQQIPLEWAFEGPLNLTRRLQSKLEVGRIAEMSPDELVAAFVERPSLHRYPAAMAARVQSLCRLIVAEYDGDPARIWTTAETGDELLRRVQALPGFGARKAKIFVALLGKQLGAGPPGWEEASAPFGEAGSHLSVADIDSPETLVLVREHKRAMKAAAKAARPVGTKAKAAPAKKSATSAGKAPRKKAAASKRSTAKKADTRTPGTRKAAGKTSATRKTA
jgi:uncharacterized HhH-GPD family protein